MRRGLSQSGQFPSSDFRVGLDVRGVNHGVALADRQRRRSGRNINRLGAAAIFRNDTTAARIAGAPARKAPNTQAIGASH
jgi:hypothetical protein